MSTTGRTEPEGTAGLVESGGVTSLDQVREILFGSQHRELARKLARTDARVTTQAEEVRNDTRRRLDVLEAHARKELDVLAASIAAQEAAQREALGTAVRESREALGALEQRVEKLEELMKRSQREFREQLLAQAKSFIDEVQHTRAELTAAVEREVVVAFGEPAEAEAKPETAREEAEPREAWEHHREAA